MWMREEDEDLGDDFEDDDDAFDDDEDEDFDDDDEDDDDDEWNAGYGRGYVTGGAEVIGGHPA